MDNLRQLENIKNIETIKKKDASVFLWFLITVGKKKD